MLQRVKSPVGNVCSTTVCTPPLCPCRTHVHDPQSNATWSTAKFAAQRCRFTHVQTQTGLRRRSTRTKLHSALCDYSLTQLPLRPANALTTFAAQGTQFPALVIHETNRNEFYTQVSRAKYGVETTSILVTTAGRFYTHGTRRHRH